jgi:hypothetical protein
MCTCAQVFVVSYPIFKSKIKNVNYSWLSIEDEYVQSVLRFVRNCILIGHLYLKGMWSCVAPRIYQKEMCVKRSITHVQNMIIILSLMMNIP